MFEKNEFKRDSDFVVVTLFGSRLYGSDILSSDYDYKGVILPSKREILLGKISNNYDKNLFKPEEEKSEVELFSLHRFIELACEGQTNQLDMIHAPKKMLKKSSEIWDEIVKNKEKLYSKNFKAFIGYARKQASKYMVKKERILAVKEIIDFFDEYINSGKGYLRIKEIWDKLPNGEFFEFSVTKNDVKMYMVCGRGLQETATIKYSKEILQGVYDDYGERVRKIENNEKIDWKSICHAIRVMIEIKSILINKDIEFPLKEGSYLRDIRLGKLNYHKEILPKMEELMEEIENLIIKSDLPSKADLKFWENFLIDVSNNVIRSR